MASSGGGGVTGDLNGLSVIEDGEAAMACSVSAVVAAALDCEVITAPRAGIRLTENLDVVESLDARDPGRKGEGMLGVLELVLLLALGLTFCGTGTEGDCDGGGGDDAGGDRLRISGAGVGVAGDGVR